MKNVDPKELERFEAQARHWWDREGDFGALHDINPLRAAYVAARMPLRGKALLDVGCGGGILSEALAEKGARVTGIDMGETALAVAKHHAISRGLSIDYLRSSAEVMADSHHGRFDGVVCMELLEHVPEPASIVGACATLVRPGGDVFFATLNRTPLSGLLAIVIAETLLGIVKKGTHRYRKFVKPSELVSWGHEWNLDAMDVSGVAYLPFFRTSWITRVAAVNYLAHFRRRH
jgi:2-polyprenyl-6-hydroxyphenyl methylase/3-demethylubiquinone-9 3-methyltransferase